MKQLIPLVALLATSIAAPIASARTWKSLNGGYTLEADAIAFDDASVIVKRTDGKLLAVKLKELSEADREYIRSKEVGKQLTSSIEKMQTWTSKEGIKIRGRVLAFGREDLTVVRKLGKAVVNGKPFDEYSPLQQKILLKILSELENRTFDTPSDLQNWATNLGIEPKVYPLQGVLMKLESGDRIAVPFFLFGDTEREVLQPGWEAWSKADEEKADRDRESLMMQTEAMEYQRQQKQQDYQRQQIEILKLNLLAARTGLTSIWEVGLEPPPGVYGRRMSVMVTAQNSEMASQMALAQNPGYRIFGVRKASR